MSRRRHGRECCCGSNRGCCGGFGGGCGLDICTLLPFLLILGNTGLLENKNAFTLILLFWCCCGGRSGATLCC